MMLMLFHTNIYFRRSTPIVRASITTAIATPTTATTAATILNILIVNMQYAQNRLASQTQRAKTTITTMRMVEANRKR